MKTKLMKRVLSMVLSVMLCMGMLLNVAPVAHAADETYTLTINNTKDYHTYYAYQIFSGSLGMVDGKQILSDIKWGSALYFDKNGDGVMDEGDYDHSSDFLEEINKTADLAALKDATSASNLAEKLALVNDSDVVDLFAEVVGKFLNENNKAGVASFVKEKNGETLATPYYEITDLKAGYYLIKDKDGSLQEGGIPGGDPTYHDSYTKYIIAVVKNETVTPKGTVPSVDKTINDTLGGTFAESEDFDINDTVYYKLEGKLPSNLDEYDKYYYKFTDALPNGIDFLELKQIYIEGHDGNLVHTFYDITDDDTTNNTLPSTGDESVLGNIKLSEIESENKISVEFDDLFSLYENILGTQKIIVKYSARVNRNAAMAEAMTNKVVLEYSNNPSGDGKGVTPEDTAHAFTYEIEILKYETNKEENKLEGAEFVLYYERTENNQLVKYYAQVITEEFVYAVDEKGNFKPGEAGSQYPYQLRPEDERLINEVAAMPENIGVVYGWTTNREEASILDTDKNGKLTLSGLDADLYYLEEIKAPVGYNKLEKPVKINIDAKYTEKDGVVDAKVEYSVDGTSQANNNIVGVGNSSGSTLPTTGGIGTTIFYVLGSILVAGTVILLVTKRRMELEM